MNNNFNSEVLINVDFKNRKSVISKLNLFQLNQCYMDYTKKIKTINEYININYNDKKKSKMDIIYMEQNYNKCMEKLKNYEQLLFLILEELEIRQIGKRFFQE